MQISTKEKYLNNRLDTESECNPISFCRKGGRRKILEYVKGINCFQPKKEHRHPEKKLFNPLL